MEIVKIKIDHLKPYKNNAKMHPQEQIEQIKKSIEEFGMNDPIAVWGEENIIVEGHGRLLACLELGYKEVECIRLDHLTEEERKAYTLAHNKLTMNTDFDYDILNAELASLDNFNMSDFGFDLGLEPEEEMEIIEDKAPEPPKIAKSKLGEIYKLGNHILMCGDSTKEEDVTKLMNGKIADLVVTDPPYNVDYVGKTKEALKIKNDKMNSDFFKIFLLSAFNNTYKILKDGGSFYVWYGSNEVVNFKNAIEESGLSIKQELIWNKNSMVIGRQDYQWKHEDCLYGWKEGAAHYFIDDRTQTTVFEDKGIEFNKMKKQDLINLLEEIYSDKISTTIINEKRPSASELHPTMKPIKLLARLIKNSSRPKEIVLDLFGGSGSTLIACEQLERKCYIMEYDPIYVDVIIKRWEDFTGQKAEKLQ